MVDGIKLKTNGVVIINVSSNSEDGSKTSPAEMAGLYRYFYEREKRAEQHT